MANSHVKKSPQLRNTLSGANIGIIKEPRCKICNSVLRNRVDRLATAGFGGTAIADEIMGQDPTLTTNRDSLRKGIERHIALHLNIKDRSIRKILEKRATEAGILMDEYESRIVNDSALLDLMVAQGLEQMSDPNIRVHFKDVLEAVKIKKEIEQMNFAVQLETLERQVWAISQAVKELVDDTIYPRIIEKAKELFADRGVIEADIVKEPRELNA